MLCTLEGFRHLAARRPSMTCPPFETSLPAAYQGRLWIVDTQGEYDDAMVIAADADDAMCMVAEAKLGVDWIETAKSRGWTAELVKVREWSIDTGNGNHRYPAEDTAVAMMDLWSTVDGDPCFRGRVIGPDGDSGGTYYCDNGEHIETCDCAECRRLGHPAYYCPECGETLEAPMTEHKCEFDAPPPDEAAVDPIERGED